MLIILETSRKEHLLRQCYTMLADSLTMERLLDWGLREADPVVVSRQMLEWAVGGGITVQTEWRQYADNSGDEPSGGTASRGPADAAAS